MKFFIKLLILILSFSTISLADVSEIKDRFFSSIETFLDGKFEHTDFTIKSTEETKPEISIETLKPITDTDYGLTFFQGSLFIHDGTRETINLGLGKRFFSDDDNIMYGLNAFYDHEFDYNHSRTSLGAEIKSSYLELNHNQYFSNSNSKTGKNGKSEEAVDGYDLELGAQVPFIPTATFYTQIFEFDVPGGNDFEGFEYSTKLEVPNSGLTLELGHTDFVDHNDEWSFQIKFSSNKINKDRPFISNEAFEKSSVADQKYERVRRENIIIKKGDSFVVKAGGF